MASASTSNVELKDAELPSWLANYLNIEWNSDDIDALLTSIDASQCPQPPALPHLPAEILILILEYIPVAYVLDWRLVCRGFRDAIDGPIIYHHLQRTRLIGYLGARSSTAMEVLNDEAYERLHLVYANFDRVVDVQQDPDRIEQPATMWANTHADFLFDQQWHQTYAEYSSSRIPSSLSLLDQLLLSRNDQGFGRLTWAIQVDTAILDLDFPLELGRRTFDVTIDPEINVFQFEWRPMLFKFLKTERALRLLMEKKRESRFSFSHTEDCLRAVRRQRLHAALDPDNKIDRHIKWSLRLLRPLWGISAHRDPSTLDPVERDAVRVLLLLRRTAALNQCQIEYLDELARDYKIMVRTMNGLTRSVKDLQSELVMPGQHDMMYADIPQWHLERYSIPINPVAWSDDLRADIESRVHKWRAQRDLIEHMQALMIASQEALTVPDDAFDVMDSEF